MFIEELETLLCTNKSGIWIKSEQEKEVYAVLLNVLKSNGFDNILEWTCATGINKITSDDKSIIKTEINKNPGLNIIVDKFKEYQVSDSMESNAIVLKDIDAGFNNPANVRFIREMLEIKANKYIPIIILSPNYEENPYLSHLFKVLDYDKVTEDEVKNLLNAYNEVKKTNIDIDKASKMFAGFNRQEIIDTLNISFYKYGELNYDILKQKKIELIKSSDVLDILEPKMSMNDIGGNKRFKEWYAEIKLSMTPEAQELGLDMPKGYLALGIPGCSKTALAHAIAKDLNIPLLQLKMSMVLSKFVGESERKMKKAQELIESCAPCVLLIDEVEKCLGGKRLSRSCTVIIR